MAIRFNERKVYLTAAHVLDGEKCYVFAGGLSMSCTVQLLDREADLAVLRIAEHGVFEPVPLDPAPQLGEKVWIVGYAGPLTVPGVIETVYSPIHYESNRQLVFSTVPLGFSGSAVLSRRGLVGIVQAVYWTNDPPFAYTIYTPARVIAEVIVEVVEKP